MPWTRPLAHWVWQRNQLGEAQDTVTVANGVVYDIAESGEVQMLNSDTGAHLGKLADRSGGRLFNSNVGYRAAVVNGNRLRCD